MISFATSSRLVPVASSKMEFKWVNLLAQQSFATHFNFVRNMNILIERGLWINQCKFALHVGMFRLIFYEDQGLSPRMCIHILWFPRTYPKEVDWWRTQMIRIRTNYTDLSFVPPESLSTVEYSIWWYGFSLIWVIINHLR